jgi:hypothetical protein
VKSEALGWGSIVAAQNLTRRYSMFDVVILLTFFMVAGVAYDLRKLSRKIDSMMADKQAD